MAEGIVLVSVWTAWALTHSLLMAPRVKAGFQQSLGPAFRFYRLGFNVFSIASFGLAVALSPRLAEPLWQAGAAAGWVMNAGRALGLAVFALAFRHFDGLEFLGLRQAFPAWAARWRPPGDRGGALARTGVYALCRHPMYLGGMLILGLDPAMDVGEFLFFVFATGYFHIGSIFEERRLAAEFGEAYRAYRRQTPRILPLPFPAKLVKPGSTGGRV